MNAEQQLAYDAIVNGKNIFLTGSAGTGKSFVIHCIRQWAKQKEVKHTVTALTGCAAVLIHGKTLHSALGLGIGDNTSDYVMNRIKKYNPQLLKTLKDLQLLIIDEVSMMGDDLFELSSAVLQRIRNCDLPFGGVQVILSGDFAQLSSVKGNFCFQSPLWNDTIQEVCTLTQIVRQCEDPTFIQILRFLRKGKCTPKILEKLKQCANNQFPENIEPTKLFARKFNVNELNSQEYSKLIREGATEVSYDTKATGKKKTESLKWANKAGMTEVKLCVGCQVVVTANIDQDMGIINGTRGIVIEVGEVPVIQLVNGDKVTIGYKRVIDESERLEVEIIPLAYAWALTVHKSQGMTLDCAEIDFHGVFAHGQAYTALSRVRNLRSVRILNIKASDFIIDPAVKEFYKL
jgi:ATP-dependent DNA helicase PIF1